MDKLSSQDISENSPVLSDDVPVTMPELPSRLVVTTMQQFKAISDPIRSRILGIIQHQPATAKQIADRLKATPGAIGHHLHVLEAAGLAQIVTRRFVRGTVANYYTRTARIFAFDFPQEVTGGSGIGLNLITQARDELIEAMVDFPKDLLRTDAFPHVRLSSERARFYHERLQALASDLLQETPDVDGQVYGVYLLMSQAPKYLQGEDTAN